MRSRFLDAVFACTFTLMFSTVNGATIVDTGPGVSDGGNNWSLATGQWLSGEFTIESAVSIDSIEGWMGPNTRNGNGTFAIYTDGGEVPGSELFSTSFFSNNSVSRSWVGVSGLGWVLATGTYWISFEVRSGQSLHTSMTGGSPNPLLNEASYRDEFGGWREADELDLGVRIEGSVIPIPPAVWLFGSGLLGLISIARRKKVA